MCCGVCIGCSHAAACVCHSRRRIRDIFLADRLTREIPSSIGELPSKCPVRATATWLVILGDIGEDLVAQRGQLLPRNSDFKTRPRRDIRARGYTLKHGSPEERFASSLRLHFSLSGIRVTRKTKYASVAKIYFSYINSCFAIFCPTRYKCLSFDYPFSR